MQQLIFSVLVTFALTLLVSLSFSLVYYVVKFFHVAHAVVITSGAYALYFFSNSLHWPFIFAILASLSVAVLIGCFCEMVVYRYLRRKGANNYSLLIASIGLYTVLQNCISIAFGDDTKVISFKAAGVSHKIIGVFATNVQIATILVAGLLYTAVRLFLTSSSTGKRMRAVASNAELCRVFGIAPDQSIMIAFVIGSGLAALAGMLFALDTSMSPHFGFNLLFNGVVATIISGLGHKGYLLAGALLVAVAQSFVGYFLSTVWMESITYLVLVTFLIWKPLGFSGERLRKVQV